LALIIICHIVAFIRAVNCEKIAIKKPKGTTYSVAFAVPKWMPFLSRTWYKRPVIPRCMFLHKNQTFALCVMTKEKKL